MTVLQMDFDELVEHVEKAAAAGDRRAERVLEMLLRHEAVGDRHAVIARLAARPVLDALGVPY
jgi:hypothetical protein